MRTYLARRLPAQDVFVVESAITNAFQSVNLAMMSIPDKARGDAGNPIRPVVGASPAQGTAGR
jgi:hypothetical protein